MELLRAKDPTWRPAIGPGPGHVSGGSGPSNPRRRRGGGAAQDRGRPSRSRSAPLTVRSLQSRLHVGDDDDDDDGDHDDADDDDDDGSDGDDGDGDDDAERWRDAGAAAPIIRKPSSELVEDQFRRLWRSRDDDGGGSSDGARAIGHGQINAGAAASEEEGSEEEEEEEEEELDAGSEGGGGEEEEEEDGSEEGSEDAYESEDGVPGHGGIHREINDRRSMISFLLTRKGTLKPISPPHYYYRNHRRDGSTAATAQISSSYGDSVDPGTHITLDHDHASNNNNNNSSSTSNDRILHQLLPWLLRSTPDDPPCRGIASPAPASSPSRTYCSQAGLDRVLDRQSLIYREETLQIAGALGSSMIKKLYEQRPDILVILPASLYEGDTTLIAVLPIETVSTA